MQDLVAKLGQPERVTARAAADVSDYRGRIRQVPKDDFLGPLKL